MKERTCKVCGWKGQLGETVGPHQIRRFEFPTDSEYVNWIITANFYCPDCFDNTKNAGNPVESYTVDSGYVHESAIPKPPEPIK